jgi:hypothetical protein
MHNSTYTREPHAPHLEGDIRNVFAKAYCCTTACVGEVINGAPASSIVHWCYCAADGPPVRATEDRDDTRVTHDVMVSEAIVAFRGP